MADEPQKDEATKAGDEILRRLLKTPPDPKKAADKRKVPPKVRRPADQMGTINVVDTPEEFEWRSVGMSLRDYIEGIAAGTIQAPLPQGIQALLPRSDDDSSRTLSSDANRRA